jgi:hypothetical protein
MDEERHFTCSLPKYQVCCRHRDAYFRCKALEIIIMIVEGVDDDDDDDDATMKNKESKDDR